MTSSWTSSFWINNCVVNEKSCMHRLIPGGFGLKSWVSQTRKRKIAKIYYFPQARAWAPKQWIFITVSHTRSAQWCASVHFFLVFLSVFFVETCFGTWNKNFPLCNVFRGLMNLLPLSSQIPMRCFSLSICSELHQEQLRIAWFREN